MTNINFDRRGSGTPLVLIHGIGSRWQIWTPVLNELAKQRDVISVDLPGFGASPAEGEPSVHNYAVQVAALIKELGLEQPEIAGNSMGGGIALELGRGGVASRVTAFSPVGFWTTPERIWCSQSLGLINKTGGPLSPVYAKAMHSKVGRGALLGLVFGKPTKYDGDFATADIAAFAAAPSFDAAAKAFADYDIRDPKRDWRTLKDIPTTIAWGNRDALLIYKTQAARAREALPFANHVTLQGCGHTPFNDDPQACLDVLLDERL